MGFITHYRGHLHEYSGKFDESMLFQKVTLEEYLAERYPTVFLETFPEQARADRDREQRAIQTVTMPGDSLWLWRRVDKSHRTDGSASEWGGLAVRRAEKIIRVWLVWREH